jgi:hypothetical protein
MASRDGVSVGAVDVYDTLVEAVDWANVRHVVQVAGGSGALLAAILRRLPDATGVLFDRPEVVAEAGPMLYAAGVADRVDLAGGRLTHDVPPGGDLYVVARALTGWTDDHVVALFRRCRAVMARSARFVIAEPTLAPARSCGDWRKLLASGGLAARCVTGLAYDWCVIEALPE